MPAAPLPTSIVAVTSLVAGSIRVTVSSSWLVTQTAPSPTATSLGSEAERHPLDQIAVSGIDSPQGLVIGVPDHPDRVTGYRDAGEERVGPLVAGGWKENRVDQPGHGQVEPSNAPVAVRHPETGSASCDAGETRSR